jgi:Tol biopolymer transport system component
VFRSSRKGVNDLYVKPLDGTGTETPLVESEQTKVPTSWSRDGQFVAFTAVDPKTLEDIWVVPPTGDRKAKLFLRTNFRESQGEFSPDGKWMAYSSNESGRYEIYVRPFPGPGGQWQISTAGGISPRWRPDSREVYYLSPEGKLMATPIFVRGSSLEAGTPIPLFSTHMAYATTPRPQYDVGRDGRFLINTTSEDSTAPITLLQNWKPPQN